MGNNHTIVSTGHIHPKEQKNWDKHGTSKQLRRLARREARKAERLERNGQ